MRILMIEDDKDLSNAVFLVLQSAGYEVDLCYEGEEGLYCLSQNTYDLAILDRMLPNMNGIELLRKARKEGVTTPVLMLTAMGGVEDRVGGLDAGADDYLTKPFDMRELLARVRALARRPGQLERADALCFGDIALNTDSLSLTGQNGACTISKKESELLVVLIKNANTVISREILFGKVWGAVADVEEASLDTYIHFVRRRLKAVSDSVQIVTLRGVGYRLEELS